MPFSLPASSSQRESPFHLVGFETDVSLMLRGSPNFSRRQGQICIYAVISMTALLAIASLAVDWGYVQCTKAEMQRTADATARGYVALYVQYGSTTATTYGPYLHDPNWGLNPIDARSGVRPTVTTTWGYWNTSSNEFVVGSNAAYPTAVRTVVTRRAANDNSLTMPIARMFGWQQTDLTCRATAVLVQREQSQPANVPATSDLWLAGMPPGSTASASHSGTLWDTTSNAAPFQATSIPVTPGTYLEFDYVSGHASHDPNVTTVPPDGNTSYILPHDQGAENGIANITAPINSLIGLFLSGDAPNTAAAPAARDYSTAASRDLSAYDDIRLKQPFFIGDGVTATGRRQRFLVPAGCTRLFLGTMDGYQWHNNNGNINCNVTATLAIELRE